MDNDTLKYLNIKIEIRRVLAAAPKKLETVPKYVAVVLQGVDMFIPWKDEKTKEAFLKQVPSATLPPAIAESSFVLHTTKKAAIAQADEMVSELITSNRLKLLKKEVLEYNRCGGEVVQTFPE